MAEPVVRVITFWKDQSGTETRSIFLVKQRRDLDGSILKSETADDVKAVTDAIERLSKLKFERAMLAIPISIAGAPIKSEPNANSTISKQAFIEFFGVPGDSLKRSKTRLWIPAPKDSVLAGNNTRVDLGNSDIQALVNDALEKLRTLGGTALQSAGSTNVRIRRTRK